MDASHAYRIRVSLKETCFACLRALNHPPGCIVCIVQWMKLPRWKCGRLWAPLPCQNMVRLFVAFTRARTSDVGHSSWIWGNAAMLCTWQIPVKLLTASQNKSPYRGEAPCGEPLWSSGQRLVFKPEKKYQWLELPTTWTQCHSPRQVAYPWDLRCLHGERSWSWFHRKFEKECFDKCSIDITLDKHGPLLRHSKGSVL